MSDKLQHVIEALEAEAEMNESRARRFAELSGYFSESHHMAKLQALAEEATEKAVRFSGPSSSFSATKLL